MATLTPLTLDEARALGALYGLDVTSMAPIPAGSVNTNVALSLADGQKVFLRIYEEQGHEGAAVEAKLLTHLGGRGVKTPMPIARADGAGFLASHRGKPTSVFPWVLGESLCQASVTAERAFAVGAALARVHAAGASFEGAGQSRFGPADLRKRLTAVLALDLPGDLRAAAERLSQRLLSYEGRGSACAGRSYEARAPLFQGLIHSDLFRDNVLWHEGEISALLDFESASLGSLPFDVMVTALAWCFGDRLEEGLMRALMDGYTSVRPLPEGEAAALYDEGVLAAVRFSVTRITDFELRPRGVGLFKDYRRFLARLDALDALGPSGLRAALGV